MNFDWLGEVGFAGITNKVWLIGLALLAAAVFAVIAIADNAVEDTLDTAKDAGRAEAVSEGKSTTLKQNKDANDAEDQIRRGGAAAVDGCLRDNRGGSVGCERFRD